VIWLNSHNGFGIMTYSVCCSSTIVKTKTSSKVADVNVEGQMVSLEINVD